MVPEFTRFYPIGKIIATEDVSFVNISNTSEYNQAMRAITGHGPREDLPGPGP